MITDGKERILAGPRELAVLQPERREARLRQQEPRRERELLRRGGRALEVPIA